MVETKTWTIRSNSFLPNYEVTGPTLQEAIRGSFQRICQDAIPWSGGWRPVSAKAEWRPDILGQRGGVEMVISAVAATGGSPAEYPVWIAAAPSDLPKPMAMRI